jgi:hypothetical protein
MPNHLHLVIVPSTEDGLRATLGEAHRHYTRHITSPGLARAPVAGTLSFLSDG